MRRFTLLQYAVLVPCLLANASTAIFAQQAARAPVALSSAEQDRYTFVLFYRQQDGPTDEMVESLKRNLADKADVATITYVLVTDPAQKAIVAKYGVARAPMPLTMALAPNGAITAMFPGSIDDAKFPTAFVTPAEAHSLQALQQHKLVFITVSYVRNGGAPQALQGFNTDPHFRDRMAVVALNANDPDESDFLADLQVTTGDPQSPAMIVLAPPGVLVGRFGAMASKDEIAAAIASANKCCDDANCKHNNRK